VSDVLIVGGVFREVLDADTTPRSRYGGSGLTAAVAAAQLGAETVLAGAVGAEDEQAVRALVAAAGVTDELLTVAGASGTFAFPTRADERSPWPLYRPAESRPGHVPQLPAAEVVLVFGIPDYDPVADGWLRDVASSATLVWDRQGWLSRARDATSVVALTASRKIYLANAREEAEEAEVAEDAVTLERQPPPGFSDAIIKLGADGVAVVDATHDTAMTHVAAFPVTVTTTIGAGDVFAGALAARLATGIRLVEARSGAAPLQLSRSNRATTYLTPPRLKE
jgi:sugar/nucleoside kinase (ribokinase family)